MMRCSAPLVSLTAPDLPLVCLTCLVLHRTHSTGTTRLCYIDKRSLSTNLLRLRCVTPVTSLKVFVLVLFVSFSNLFFVYVCCICVSFVCFVVFVLFFVCFYIYLSFACIIVFVYSLDIIDCIPMHI